jgi:hypothetical protein
MTHGSDRIREPQLATPTIDGLCHQARIALTASGMDAGADSAEPGLAALALPDEHKVCHGRHSSEARTRFVNVTA